MTTDALKQRIFELDDLYSVLISISYGNFTCYATATGYASHNQNQVTTTKDYSDIEDVLDVLETQLKQGQLQ